jgi:hypothetical protein
VHLGTAELREWATTKDPAASQGPSGTGPAHRVREYLLALLAFTALTLAITWPLALQLSSSVYGGMGDSLGYIAGLAYQHTFGWSLFGSAHVAYWGAPIGFTQDSVAWLNQQLVIIPAHMLTAVAGPVAAYNILILAGLALSGLGMYVFCREIGVRIGPSLWAGFVYTIFPWHLQTASGHITQVPLWGFPLLALAGIRWFQKPTLLRAFVMGLLLAALLLTDPYFVLIGAFLWATILVVVVGWRWRRDGWYTALRQLAQGLAGTLWAPVLIMGYEYIAGRTTGDEYLKARQTINVSEVYHYAARWFEFIDLPALNPYLGSASVRLFSGTFHLNIIGEGPLFVGFVTLGLAGGYVVYALWRRAALTATEQVACTLGLAAAVVGVVMSLSTTHTIAGVSIPSPAELIFRIQPGWRVYSRFIVLVVFGVLVLAVLALDRATGRLPTWARPVLIAAVLAASYVELAFPLPVLKIGPTPSGYVALAKLDRGAILAEYPMAQFDDVAAHVYMYWQTIHHHPMVNDAPLGSRADAFREDILSLDDPTVPPLLAFMGVRLVTINDATAPGAGLEAVDPGAGLQPRIYRVTAAPAGGIALFRTGVYASVVGPDGRVKRWIVSSPASVDVIVRHSGVYDVSATVMAFPTARVMVVSGQAGPVRVPIADHHTVVHFRLRLASGTNVVTLRTIPSAGAATGDPRRLLMGNWVIGGPSRP